MTDQSATAIAHPNIALIKYWGDINTELHLPANGSISMNLEALFTQTTVCFDPALSSDQFSLNGVLMIGKPYERVNSYLHQVRQLARIATFARVESQNNFPNSAGLASSASGFAALGLAATRAAGLALDNKDLSRLARRGSGSACRSIPGGFVEWEAGKKDEDSYAHSIAIPEYWDLVDCIALVNQEEKLVSSSEGHALASTSVLQPARLADTPRRLNICRTAILERDFETLAKIVELDSNLMHAVMISSTPALFYWQPATMEIMHAVQGWRSAGMQVCYTIDAGPNVHVLCPTGQETTLSEKLLQLPGVNQVIISHPGGPATLL